MAIASSIAGFLLPLMVLGPSLRAQAPGQPPAKAKVTAGPVLEAGEGLAISGTDGETRGYGASRAEHAMEQLAKLVWLKFEGADWSARDVAFKCAGTWNGSACWNPKGHKRVDLEKAARENCDLAFLAWSEASAERWKQDYGEGGSRMRMEEAFRPFLGRRMPGGEGVPAMSMAWIRGGALLRTTPEQFLGWLNEAEQAELLSRCQRMLGSRAHHFKDLANVEDWWFQTGTGPAPSNPGPGGAAREGAWVVGGNGSLLAVLHLPIGRTAAEDLARFKAIMGIKKK